MRTPQKAMETEALNECRGAAPEEVFPHAVHYDLIYRKQLQRLFIAVKEILYPAQRVQLLCPFEEREPEGLLQNHTGPNVQ